VTCADAATTTATRHRLAETGIFSEWVPLARWVLLYKGGWSAALQFQLRVLLSAIMPFMPEVEGCEECRRLERAFIHPRTERTKLLLKGQLTQDDEKRLSELEREEDCARQWLEDHHTRHSEAVQTG
jgi:hypothetical protein